MFASIVAWIALVVLSFSDLYLELKGLFFMVEKYAYMCG